MSTETRFLLALTADQAERRKALGVIAKRLGLELVAVDTTPAALSWLMSHEPALVVLDTRIAKAEQLGLKLRGKKALATVPVIFLSEELSDVFTANSYAAGADDVIPVHASAQLAQRLRSLPKGRAAKQDSKMGVAVVADSNRGRCDLMTRVLVGAGYDVKTAIDERSLQFYQRQHGPKLFVVNSEVTDVRQAISMSRRGGDEVAWVITASRRELESLGEALHDAARVVVTGANAPPTDALFLANELGYEAQTSRRSGSRKLLGTVVRFREAGTDEEDFGFTYNVSEQGVYVRTVTPPEYDEVWLELRPPKAKHWVRLLGRVAWRHAFSPGEQSLSPPGFGVELLAGLGHDLEDFKDCFRAFADTAPRGAGRSTFVPVRRASIGMMPRIAPAKPDLRPSSRSAPPPHSDPPSQRRTSSQPASGDSVPVRDSWLASEELESVPPDPPSDDPVVRDSEWDRVEVPPIRTAKQKLASAQAPDAALGTGQAAKAARPAHSEARKHAAKAADETSVAPHDAVDLAAQAASKQDETSEQGDVRREQERSTAGDADEGVRSGSKTAPREAKGSTHDGDVTAEGDDRTSEDRRDAVFDAKPREGEKAPEKSGTSFLKLALIAGLAVGVIALVYTASRGDGRAVAPAKSATAFGPEAESVPAKPSVAAPALDSPGPVAASSPQPASPVVSHAPTGLSAPAAPFDVTSLERDQGALKVVAPGNASVYVLGVKRGEVGDWLTVKCGMQFVRLGRGEPPAWVSKGRTVVIPCKKTTTAEFEISQ